MPTPITIAKNDAISLDMLSNLVNRHGCITGATGTGKTVTLQKIAQSLSEIGVPVFMADVKGDLSGIAKPGAPSEKMAARLGALKLEAPQWAGCPVTFWDVFGEQGHPVRATVSDLGPLLLARMLNLNDTQEGVLQLVFRIADDNGLLLLDSKDLRAMLQHVGDNAADFKTSYGNISAASIGAIQRGLIAIEEQGGDQFFGEPMLNIDDLLQTDANGKGVINILSADKLMNAPRLYAVFLLWMLSELFENLPEVGDLDKPKLVFFFDEAHLLFTDAPKALLQKIEQVVRLIRSKGVGVFFVTQNPIDIPDTVLGQLGNRVQHALRAYTPRDQKAVKAAAETFRPNPSLEVSQVITELGVGEALVSFLDEQGAPRMVERVFILPPASQLGPLDAAERKAVIAGSIVAGVYEKTVDRESAYEKLSGRVAAGARQAQDGADAPAGRGTPQRPSQPTPQEAASGGSMFGDVLGGLFGQTGKRDTAVQAMVKSAVRSIGSQVGREIIRGVLGSIMKKR
ncbi:DNA helicase HerA-like ATPase [Duganella sp. 1411]|uniref:helicase HerA-like C-terminal domain-containing protein n=1 Tax=Duganella sp. 1411 TaxID=2806572 RepID=UPI001AE58BBA|nr:helicase HerA-like C-terminal domain-containing protein [Duganella sp. 1411]MBP1205311.1 DNA helicase HerA-like ATPase [Duganella sp. 1411]